MPQPNPNNFAGNPLDLTEAEIAAQHGFDADGNEVAPTPEPVVAEAPPAEAATPPEPAPDIAPTAAPLPSAALPELRTDGPRDFKAEREQLDARFNGELLALKTQYQNNAVDDEAYEATRDAILARRQDERDELTLARAKFETRQELAHEFADHSWQQNVSTFLAQPENAVLLRSAEIQQVWQASMQSAVNEAAAAGKALTTDLDIMTAGRDRLFQQLGLSVAVAPPVPAPEPPRPNQAPPVTNLPPSLSHVPAAAPSGAKHSADSLASQDITDLERVFAGMSEEQQEAILRTVPGAFVD